MEDGKDTYQHVHFQTQHTYYVLIIPFLLTSHLSPSQLTPHPSSLSPHPSSPHPHPSPQHGRTTDV